MSSRIILSKPKLRIIRKILNIIKTPEYKTVKVPTGKQMEEQKHVISYRHAEV